MPPVPTSLPANDIQLLIALVSPLLSSLLLGYLFTYGLQGILLVQVYHYYISFPDDMLFWKILVYLVLFTEFVQTVLASMDAFHIFALGWGKYQLLDDLNLLFLTPIMSGAIGLICHCVFAYRLWSLSKSRLVCGSILFLALLACCSGFAFGAKLSTAGNLSNVIHTPNIYLICGLWNGSGAGCDVAIAGFMTFYLSRSSTGYKSTDVLLTRIIRLTIETGLFTAAASLASAILFVGYRDNFKISIFFVVPAIMLAKLYAVTILAMFNNRAVGNGRNAGEASIQTFESRHPEIRIGRSVVQQVWADNGSVTHLQTLGGDTSPTTSRRSDNTMEKKVSISTKNELCPGGFVP